MTSVLDIEHELDGEVVVRDHFVGDIRCKKLTITRTGTVKGNIVCKHLQLGGYVEGIAVCHLLEANSQGRLHGSLYYAVKKDEALVSGLVDYREPPAAVWSVVMRDNVKSSVIEPDTSFDENTTFADLVLTDEPDLNVDVEALAEELNVATSSTPVERHASEVTVGLVEASSKPSKFLNGDIKVEQAPGRAVEPAAPAWVSTGRKVQLGAKFF
jgi:hypothetical protein